MQSLQDLHQYKKTRIANNIKSATNFSKKHRDGVPVQRSDYISYSLLRSDPEIAKIIETIYRK